MTIKEKVRTMDGMDRCDLNNKIAGVVDRAFLQKLSWQGAKDELNEIYRQFGSKVSRADFNTLIESVLESTVDCYHSLIDDFEGVENVIKV